jgi:hypothetical protein
MRVMNFQLPQTAIHRRAARRVLLTLLTVVSIPFLAGLGASDQTSAIGAATAERQATPTAGTPAASPSASDAPVPCSVLLGIGEETDACLSVVNALPGPDGIMLSLAGTTSDDLSDLAFGAFVDFFPITPGGTTDVRIMAADGSESLLGESAVALEPGTAYVLVASLQYDAEEPTVTAVPVNLGPLPAGKARVAIHHAVTDAAELALQGVPAPLSDGVDPGASTDGAILDAGSYGVTLVPAGDPEIPLAELTLEIEPGLSYIAVIAGTTGDQSILLLYAAAPVSTTA